MGKKNFIKLVVCSGLTLGFVGSLQAQVIVDIDFSKGQGYVDGPLVGQPSGKTPIWVEGEPVAPSTTLVVSNETLVLKQDGVLNHWLLFTIPNQTGKFKVTWEWQYVGPTDGNCDVGFCISDPANFSLDGNDAPTYNEQGTMVRLYTNNVIEVRNGDWQGGGSYEPSDPSTGMNYTDGKKIYMREEVDATESAESFSVFARKEGEQEVAVGSSDLGFRRAYETGLNTIAIWVTGSNADVSIIIDNIKITGPAAISNWELHE